jgi:uroporphyrinogen-III synthase
VMARGNRRERIFRDEADRLLFYQTLGEACERTGWLAGKGIATRKTRTYRSAPLFQAHNEKEARRLLDGGLAASGLSARELDSLPGSDVRKVALASLILERTVARQSWIADKLAMRSAANVSQQVRRYRTRRPRLAAAFREYLESASLSRFVD